MGAAASVNDDTPVVQLVDFTNKEQFLSDCSKFYDTVQSSDGSVAKARIYSVLNGLHKASEILNVFMIYCPDGRMTSDIYVELCRDIKLLDKAFTSENALSAFESGRNCYFKGQAESSEEGINFAGFLYHVVPFLAASKSMDEESLTDRLARHHKPSPIVEKKISFKRALSSPMVSSKNALKKILSFSSADETTLEERKELQEMSSELMSLQVSPSVESHVVSSDHVVDLAIKNQAAVKIQTKFRSRMAKRVSLQLKQLKKGKRIKDCAMCPRMNSKTEKALKKVFQFYCPNDDIDIDGFFALVKDGGLLNRKYLAVDVNYNFKETIAKVELNETPKKYNPGVRFHKRFTFMVFKDIALCFVALSTGLPYDKVVETILKNNED